MEADLTEADRLAMFYKSLATKAQLKESSISEEMGRWGGCHIFPFSFPLEIVGCDLLPNFHSLFSALCRSNTYPSLIFFFFLFLHPPHPSRIQTEMTSVAAERDAAVERGGGGSNYVSHTLKKKESEMGREGRERERKPIWIVDNSL